MDSFMKSQAETRAEMNAAKTERAYAELAASITPRGETPPTIQVSDTERTEEAVRACLEYMGVKPGNVPGALNDEDELIEWLCRPSGTMYRTVRLDKGWHSDAFGAMLGHMDTGEPIALIPRGAAGYWCLDSATGERVKVTPSVAAHINDEATFFYKPLPSRPLNEEGDLPAFVFGAFSIADYLVVIGATIAVTLIGLLPAWANKIAFGVVAPSGKAELVLPIAEILVGVVVTKALIGICRNILMARISLKLDVMAESATYARILSLPASFFKNYSSGDLSRRVDNMSQICRQIVSVTFGSALTALFSLVYIFQIFAYTPSLAIPAVIISAVQLLLSTVITLATMRYERKSMEADVKVSGVVTALLNGIQKIKLAGAEDLAFAKWARGYSEYTKATYNRPTLLYVRSTLVTFVGLLGAILICYIAATTHVAYDDYMAFSVSFGQITASLLALTEVASQVAQIRPMFEVVRPILEAEPETADDRPSVPSLTGSIEVSGVSFRYGEDQPYVLQDLSFTVRPGEYVAIVGESGCGKSTIMRLLLGFEEVDEGSIFYGPYDVREVNLRSLRQHIGSVMQNGKLFMGNIYANIIISTPTATLDDAWRAAEIAGIADDIRAMPMGMQTLVTEGGGGISGGQRQRIMIARAVCGDRNILMFDEATSALDNVTQKNVSDSLANLNCTRIVIAHRLSTVRECDRILVIAEGGIAEEGTYDELIAKGGLFANLVARQQVDF